MERIRYKYFKRAKDLRNSWLNRFLKRGQLARQVAKKIISPFDKFCLKRGLKKIEDIIE